MDERRTMGGRIKIAILNIFIAAGVSGLSLLNLWADDNPAIWRNDALSSPRNIDTSRFFKEYWAEWDPKVTNYAGRNLRVNDEGISLHASFGRRGEASANGFTLVSVPEDLFQVERSELCLEMWGGHPGTANRRFFLNGRGPYEIPGYGSEEGNCVYANPTIPLETSHLVTGHNALQFACNRGTTFWGHFIVDQLAVRCYLRSSHPDLGSRGLERFQASVETAEPGKTIGPQVRLITVIEDHFLDQVESVEYFARFEGYDENGNADDDDWHGYTHKRVFERHLGRSTTPPFEFAWDTTMIPSQKKPMAVRALLRLRGGIGYWTPELTGLVFPPNRPLVQLFKCKDLPAPFWSRAAKESKATLELPASLENVEKALLLVRVWDGGEGSVKEPFTLNGHPYPVTSGKANHDLIFSAHEVPLDHLKPGINNFRVLSDTEHHGIEVLLPGPALIVRFKANY